MLDKEDRRLKRSYIEPLLSAIRWNGTHFFTVLLCIAQSYRDEYQLQSKFIGILFSKNWWMSVDSKKEEYFLKGSCTCIFFKYKIIKLMITHWTLLNYIQYFKLRPYKQQWRISFVNWNASLKWMALREWRLNSFKKYLLCIK